MSAYGIIRIIGVVVLLEATSVQCLKIHERTTDDEMGNHLQTTSDKMSESDMTPVRNSRHKRLDQNFGRKLNDFGKRIVDYLNPSDGQLFGADTPVWLAFASPDKVVQYKKMQKGIVGKMVSKFYTGKYTSYSEEEDFPKRFQQDATTRRTVEAPKANTSMSDTLERTIFNSIQESTSVTEEERMRRWVSRIRKALRSDNGTDASRIKRTNREIIYPSLLVQTDFNGSKTTQNDFDYYDEIIYQLAFWNAVDLRFRQFNNPKIRIRIAGIIIGLDRSATPYVQNHDPNEDASIWDLTRKYWWNMGQRDDFPCEAYNLVVTVTNNDAFHNRLGRRIAVTAPRSFCTPPMGNNLSTIAIVSDFGGFEGISKATLALGRLLGLDYDTASGDECDSSNYFIMQTEWWGTGPNSLKWSPCSLNSLSFIFSWDFMHCYDKPAEFHPPGRPIPRVLPGDVLGIEKQCQGRGFHSACTPEPDMCMRMQCYRKGWDAVLKGWWCKNSGPAADGTSCGAGKKCLMGKCECVTDECFYTD